MIDSTILGTFATPSSTANAGTAIVRLIPPFRGSSGGPLMYKLSNGLSGTPNWCKSGFTHLTQAVYTAAATAHTLVVMRPFNWAVVASDVAANAQAVTLLTDPGVYSTSFKYPLPPEAGGVVASVADNAIAASDYVAVQLRDGTWHVSAVTSVSGLAVTMTTATPNVTGGGIEAGSIMFFFGASGDSNPQTGQAHVSFLTVANARTSLLPDAAYGSVSGLNPGDPLLLYSANASNAGTISVACGYYAK